MNEKVTLTMSREQAEAVMNACELLARLHQGQFEELVFRFETAEGNDKVLRREAARDALKLAAKQVFGLNNYGWPDIQYKSMEAKRVWAVYETMRHAAMWHDHPEGGYGIPWDEPMGYGEELPRCVIGPDNARVIS